MNRSKYRLNSWLSPWLLLGFLSNASFLSSVSAHGPHEHSAGHDRHAAKSATAKGVVYEDVNNNRRRDPEEAGIAGIRVSNGESIVLTDAEGRYSLPVDDDEIVFVI